MNALRERKMKLLMEKIKGALSTSLRPQPERSLLLLMGLKEVFRSIETKDTAASSPASASLLFCMWNHIQWRGKGDRPSS